MNDAQKNTGLRVEEVKKRSQAHTPVHDPRQVELQEALSEGHEGQQAGVEEEQEQHAPLHSEAVRHGAVLHGETQRVRFVRGALSPPSGRMLYRLLAVLHDGRVGGGPDGDFLSFVAPHHVGNLHTVEPWNRGKMTKGEYCCCFGLKTD